MGFDPNKGGNGDTGNSGNNNVWDMEGFSYAGYGNVVYRDDLTNQNNSTDQNKDKAKITAREDFDDDADDFTVVDLDKSVNTSDRDYGKAIRDAMTVNDVNYSSDRPIQIVDSGINVQDVSKNYNDSVYATPAQANVIDGGGNNPGNSINIVDDSLNTEPKDGASVDVDAVKNRIQNGVDNDVNKFNPGDPNIVREYEEDTGNAEKRGLVAGIMEKVRKSGVGKLFVKTTIGALLLGSIVTIGANSGLLNKKATQNATAIEQRALGYQDGEADGSELATKEIDELLGNQSETEKSAENLDTKVDIKIANGAVLEGVDFRLGGDNSGADMLDFKNMDSSHAGAFTSAYTDWINGGAAAEYKSTIGNEEATNAFHLKTAERMNSRMGNVGLLSRSYYDLADFEDKNMINQENMGENVMRLMQDPVEYERQKAIVEQKNIELAKKVTYDFVVLERDKDIYCSEFMKLYDQNGNEIEKDSDKQYSASDISRVEYITDTKVNPVEGGALVRKSYDNETGLDYVESHPEVKEKKLRESNLIKSGATDKQIQWAMSHWVYVGELVVCGQPCWEEEGETHDSSTTYKAEYITPRASSTSDREKAPSPVIVVENETPNPENNTTTTENKITTGTRHIITSTGGKHTHNTIIREDEKPRDKETPKDKEIPPEPEKETPKDKEVPPDENPKGGEKVLEAKTDNVVGGNEFNSQKAGTATDQNAAPLAGEATNNSMMESSGNQLSNREVADQSVIGEFTENNASVSKEESEYKGISTSVTNENLATNSSEAPADSFERQTVADEVVNESNGETAAQSSYDTSAAEANYDFYSAF